MKSNYARHITVQLDTESGKIHLLLLRKICSSKLEPIKFPTRFQRLATAATLECEPWRKAAKMGSLVTLERVLSENNEDLIF